MPTSTAEAVGELKRMMRERDLTMAWVARRINKNLVWVSRRMRSETPMTIEQYSLMKSAIGLVPVNPALQAEALQK